MYLNKKNTIYNEAGLCTLHSALRGGLVPPAESDAESSLLARPATTSC